MKLTIILTDIETTQSKVMMQATDLLNAKQIVLSLNKLNTEAARLTGKALRYVYSYIETK